MIADLMQHSPSHLSPGNTWLQQAGESQLNVEGTLLGRGSDCLRDEDWQVYRLYVKEAGCPPVRLLASKTGGDAAQICAPLEMHGSEEEDFSQDGCSTSANLSFRCRILMVSNPVPF